MAIQRQRRIAGSSPPADTASCLNAAGMFTPPTPGSGEPGLRTITRIFAPSCYRGGTVRKEALLLAEAALP